MVLIREPYGVVHTGVGLIPADGTMPLAAHLARNRRITAWVKETLAELRADPDGVQERPFVVYGTMADARWLNAGPGGL
jgi:hypothetical protein